MTVDMAVVQAGKDTVWVWRGERGRRQSIVWIVVHSASRKRALVLQALTAAEVLGPRP